MSKIGLFITALSSFIFGRTIAQEPPITPPSDFYGLSFNTITGEKFEFKSLKGKKVLIVNTASKCGFTPQFKELEELHQKYGNNLIVIGFPSNDFGAQDPGSNSDIKQFCELNYGVTFLMMEKSSVKGKEKNDVYKWLSEKDKNGWNTSEPGWNFCKYLIDEKGRLTAFFPSKVKPMSTEITSKL
ncbi:MAG: glutathione peroxidase [Bacteroidales bacterium]|jgi:glutathione peroxidase